MPVRPYTRADAAATREVFDRAVRETAARDYTPEQIEAWAPRGGPAGPDLEPWHRRRSRARTYVATVDAVVVGFSDMDDEGYLDMMFVHPEHGGRGVATALLAAVLDDARQHGIDAVWTHASRTARPFFARHGFVVEEERHPVIRGVELTNYLMRRPVTTA